MAVSSLLLTYLQSLTQQCCYSKHQVHPPSHTGLLWLSLPILIPVRIKCSRVVCFSRVKYVSTYVSIKKKNRLFYSALLLANFLQNTCNLLLALWVLNASSVICYIRPASCTDNLSNSSFPKKETEAAASEYFLLSFNGTPSPLGYIWNYNYVVVYFSECFSSCASYNSYTDARSFCHLAMLIYCAFLMHALIETLIASKIKALKCWCLGGSTVTVALNLHSMQ